MAVKLDKSPTVVGYIRVLEETVRPNGYGFNVLAYYADTDTATDKTVYVQLQLNASGIYGSIGCNVNGTTTTSSFSGNTAFEVGSFTVQYDASTGKCRNKSLNVGITSESAHWDAEHDFDARPANSVAETFYLPDIDPTPVFNTPTVAIQNKGYSSSRVTVAVAGKTKLRVTIAGIKYARSISYKWKGASVEGSGIIDVTYSTSSTVQKTFDIDCPEYTGETYNLTVSVTIANNSSSTTKSASAYTVYGYTVPTYASGTVVNRWATDTSSGTSSVASPTGLYGRLYLKWSVKSTVPNNAIKSLANNGIVVTVTIDSTTTTLTKESGSIADGYLIYFTPQVALTKEAKFTITLTDEIGSNVITVFGVTKAVMPLSLYQSGNNVGVAIGAMSTAKGFYIYEQKTSMPVKMQVHEGTTLYAIYIDANGVLYIGNKAVTAYTKGSTLTKTSSVPSDPDIDYGPDEEV